MKRISQVRIRIILVAPFTLLIDLVKEITPPLSISLLESVMCNVIHSYDCEVLKTSLFRYLML